MKRTQRLALTDVTAHLYFCPRLWGVLLGLCLQWGVMTEALAQRVALVIGNAAYADKPLKNPANDAQDVAAELGRLGFAVKPQLDLNRKSLYAAIRQFANQAKSAQLAVVYYSGHGMQSAGENYLIPTDARINDEKDIRSDGVPLRDLLGDLDEANVQKTVVILDACRDNPYQTRTRGGPKGLARVETAGNATVVAFATAEGKTADDGNGRNGVYTTALLRQLRQPAQDIRDLLDETANAVARQTKDQKPKIYGDPGAFKGVYLASIVPEPVAPAPERGPSVMQKEAQAWAAAQRTHSVAGYSTYLAEYPNGSYAAAARVAKTTLVKESKAGSTISDYSMTTETTCSPELISKYSCNKCFAGRSIYIGESMPLFSMINNTGNSINRYYKSDLKPPEVWNTYGAGIVTYAKPEWELSEDIFGNCDNKWCKTPSGKELIYIKPHQTVKAEQTSKLKNIGLVDVHISNISNENRERIRDNNFTIVYTRNAEFRDLSHANILGSDIQKVCQVLGAHFCGDGLVEPNIEACDDGAENGSPGKCNSTCTAVIKNGHE